MEENYDAITCPVKAGLPLACCHCSPRLWQWLAVCLEGPFWDRKCGSKLYFGASFLNFLGDSKSLAWSDPMPLKVDEDGNMKFLQGTGLPKQPEGPPPRKIIGQSRENE